MVRVFVAVVPDLQGARLECGGKLGADRIFERRLGGHSGSECAAGGGRKEAAEGEHDDASDEICGVTRG